jgi:hypothetical protein
MPLLSSLRPGAFVLVISMVFLAGCGGSSRIEGTVTFDGQPVDGGGIVFIGSGTQGEKASGRIEGGKYSLEAKLPSGSYKVEIRWLKPTGKSIPNKSDAGTSTEETKEVIPMEYNSQSKLTADIKSGQNTFNFDLKSGGAVDTRPSGAPPVRSKAVGD